ncbi:MAG: MOSC domain-containing protein [Actinomycetota bacterium]|nr:MOSC domain-containing protein [Actinomycetota bacterium]
MYSVGPYTFTQTDAAKTVHHARHVWEFIEAGRDPAVIAHLFPTLTDELAHDLPAVWHAWRAAGEAMRAAGQLPTRTEGTVTALHTSGGGLPKLPIEQAEITWAGVAGDRQGNRTHHGRPWQALCIWSDEVIDAFRAQGHPIAPGLAGENITVRGLPWAEVRPGVRLQLGEVLCEVSAYAVPCTHNRRWFTDGDFMVMHHDRGPVSRVYATVLQPGSVAAGDAAVLEP